MPHGTAAAQQYSPSTIAALTNVEYFDTGRTKMEPPIGSLGWIYQKRHGVLALARALDRQELNSYEQKDLAALVVNFSSARIYFPECGYQLNDIPPEDIEVQLSAVEDYLKTAEDGLDLVNGRASITSSNSCKLENQSLSDERTQTGENFEKITF